MKGIIGDDVLFDFMYFFYFIMILYGFLQMESNNLKEQLQKISMISHLFIMYYLLFIIYINLYMVETVFLTLQIVLYIVLILLI